MITNSSAASDCASDDRIVEDCCSRITLPIYEYSRETSGVAVRLNLITSCRRFYRVDDENLWTQVRPVRSSAVRLGHISAGKEGSFL